MAIALDNTADLGNTAGTTLTTAYTCSGSNRLLVVGVDENQTAGGSKVTGVTYAGVAMTQHASSPTSVAGRFFSLWWLIAPATGSNNVVVTVTAGGDLVNAAAASYTGVSQTGQPDASAIDSVTTVTSETGSVTTVADNCWLVGLVRNSGSSETAGANTIIRVNPGGGAIYLIDSNSAQTPAGSKSMAVTWTNNSDSKMYLLSFSPSLVTGTSDDLYGYGDF